MGEKQIQQHSQHFNLSGEAKQKLEQLTAKYYPGKKRRQSQLVEDLITQAFAKEYAMSTMTQEMQERSPHRLAAGTQEVLNLARQVAYRFKATEVTPEHLLLGFVEQHEKGVFNILMTLRIDVSRMRSHLDHLLMQEWKQYRRKELLEELKPGETRLGSVSHLTNFGAFVDLGGTDGLIHISQMDRDHVHHPSDVLHVGQEIEVQVLSVDTERKKISLSLKGAYVDPWLTAEQHYAPGQIVTGIVTKITPFGAFACIEEGIEGLIHFTELPEGSDTKSILHEGALLQLRILRLDAEHHRLRLSVVEEAEGNEIVPFTELDMKHEADGIEKIPSEDVLASREKSAIPDVGTLRERLLLSSEVQVSLHRAVWIAKRMHSLLAQPEHLLLSILQNQRIQDFLAPLLPFPEMLRSYKIDASQDTSRQGGACPLCGQLVQLHWKHCVYCGQSLSKRCPKCSTPCAEIDGTRFCYECGNPLE